MPSLLYVALENMVWISTQTAREWGRYWAAPWWYKLRGALAWAWLGSSPNLAIARYWRRTHPDEPLRGGLPEDCGDLTYGELLPGAACLMLRVVEEIALGESEPQPQKVEGPLRRARYVKPGEALIDWEEWGCQRVGAFLRGASLWYEPFPIFPCLVRLYQPGQVGPSYGKPGTNHWRLWKGWISCKDGIVPYKVAILRYEFWRLLIPILILLIIGFIL